MTAAFPKPVRPVRKRQRIARTAAPRRRGPTLGQKRHAAKAKGPGVDQETWFQICEFYRDEFGVIRCAYGCGRPALVCDHVVPLSRGGLHSSGNVVPTDEACNFRKGTQTWIVPRPHPWMQEAKS